MRKINFANTEGIIFVSTTPYYIWKMKLGRNSNQINSFDLYIIPGLHNNHRSKTTGRSQYGSSCVCAGW